MGLPKAITWPIAATGIQTKNAPFQLAPGGQLVLDNVRQERKDEWVTRAGFTHDVRDDITTGVPVTLAEAPWGGFVGLTRQTDYQTAGRVYTPDAMPRWHLPPIAGTIGVQPLESCSQLTPSIWSRAGIYPANGATSQVSSAEGEGYRLTASWSKNAGKGIQVSFGATDGTSLQFFEQILLDPAAQRPKCVYSAAAHRLCLFFVDALFRVLVYSWNTQTGNSDVSAGIVSAAAYAAFPDVSYLDARDYGGATVTVIYRNATATGELDIAEYNPATNATVVAHSALNCANCISLLPDPDNSGTRLVALTNVTPQVKVVRLNSAGAVLTNDLIEAVDGINIAGCAYQAGAGYQIVYQDITTAGFPLKARKKRSGVLSAVSQLSPGLTGGMFKLASNGWRESDSDAMRYMLALVGGPAADTQTTYYEMALEYENGSAFIFNQWTEPQARLLPLNAMATFFERASLPHVFRTGTDRFVTALPRITKISDVGSPVSGTFGFELAIDAWAVQYKNSTTYTGQNEGPGTQTATGVFFPAGSLLQTATGQVVCCHGSSSLPFAPVLTPSAGAGALSNGVFIYGVTWRMPDENGNDWRSPMSETTAVTLAGANNTITAFVQAMPFENLVRRRIVEIWRSDHNGSTLKLFRTINGTILDTNALTIVDATSDTLGGETYTGEVQTGLTPPLSHVTSWNDRVWGVDRDFPTLVWFTKPLSQGLLPEFVRDPATGVRFAVDIDDAYGPITGLVAMDDKIVAFKERAIYVSGGDGPDNTGNGQFPQFTRISSETGMIAGSPFAALGTEIYFVSLGGLWRISAGQRLDFVGASIDKYLSMPLLSSPETVIGMVVSPGRNEVRVQTTNYRFVHDRTFDCWIRDTGGMLSASGIIMTRMLSGTTQTVLTSGGALWREADDSVAPDDAGVTYAGTVRTAWIKPDGFEGWLRLFQGRVLGECTATATTDQPTITVFYDNDDTVSESFQPQEPMASSTGPIHAIAQVRKQRCASFSLQITLPSQNATVRLDAWSATVEALPGAIARPVIKKWTTVATALQPTPPTPPSMDSVPLPTPLKTWEIAQTTNALLGSNWKDTKDVILRVKNLMIASGHWRCMQSCNGVVSAPGVDNWITYADLKTLGVYGVQSWMRLRNDEMGAEVLLVISPTESDPSWCDCTRYFSPAAGFTGGTTVARPTATDEVSGTTTATFLATGPAAGDSIHIILWTSSDGLLTRVAFVSDHTNGTMIAWWQWERLYAPAAPWASPNVSTAWANGQNVAPRMTGSQWTANGGLGGVTKNTRLPSGYATDALGTIESDGGFYPAEAPGANESTSQYAWTSPSGFYVNGAPAGNNGLWGWFVDQWWTTSALHDGDTAGDNREFIILGAMMLPWDGSTPALGRVSVNVPTARFFGREFI